MLSARQLGLWSHTQKELDFEAVTSFLCTSVGSLNVSPTEKLSNEHLLSEST